MLQIKVIWGCNPQRRNIGGAIPQRRNIGGAIPQRRIFLIFE